MVRSQPPSMSCEERRHQSMEVVYGRKTRERRIFLDELTSIRRNREKELFRRITKLIGPNWYQVLSVPQRQALDKLEISISQDLLEGLPCRTARILRDLGIFPQPSKIDIMNCLCLSHYDAKEMLAQLFSFSFGHNFDLKEISYCLNAKLLLSAIYYLGLGNLIQLLKERFKPDPPKKAKKKPAVVKKESVVKAPLESPYLEKFKVVMYVPKIKKPFKPAPLPNLDGLNEPWEERPPLPKPKPPPPPPPPPKKVVPLSYCDELAGIKAILPYSDSTVNQTNAPRQTIAHSHISHRKRGMKLYFPDSKKAHQPMSLPVKKLKKPVVPSTGLWNMQYTICGICKVNGKTVFLLGNVTALCSDGDLIQGGYKRIGNEYINIHCGFKAKQPPSEPMPCDCVKKWTGTVFKYVRRTKCYCDHHYDYGNDEDLPPDELTYYEKPTRYSPGEFNFQNIYNLNPKSILVEKEFRKLWDTDSILQSNAEKSNLIRTKNLKVGNCLGQNPKPEDYLKCALRYMQDINIAAKLPDVHLAPELKEWMRRRIFGPFARAEKREMIHKSNMLWQLLDSYTKQGLGIYRPPVELSFRGRTNWLHKQKVYKKYKKYVHRYRCEMYKAQAYATNLFWTTMFQAEFPDKNFRRIFFSYVYENIEDILFMHPYIAREAITRRDALVSKRYCCLPDGVDDLNTS